MCTRQDDVSPLEYEKILEEVEKFRGRMKEIIKYATEESEKMEKKEGQIRVNGRNERFNGGNSSKRE